jgi:D-2-hydroxyacid dehydrogenase (NADP+)
MSSTRIANFPRREATHVLFAHVAYRLDDAFAARNSGIGFTQVRSYDELRAAMPAADVLVVSGLWREELLDLGVRLRFIQSIGAGTDQFDKTRLAARGVRLASAQGVNERAVSEHAMALILAMARQLHLARDNQHAKMWRGMISDVAKREVELGGKTLVIVGLGRIGSRLAALARAFGMHVIGVKRSPAANQDVADEVVAQADLLSVLPRADYVALTCPLTPQTEGLIGKTALATMKPTAVVVNVARGKVVDEPALIAALEAHAIAGAALDCVAEEPLPAASLLWGMRHVLITPHTAGETQRYEENVVDVLLDNLARLWSAGPVALRNGIV